MLSRSLPGIYRLKDDNNDLARFLQIMASPLAETEASIGQLYDDLFGASARGDFLPLIGDLIGADIDPALPASLQRATETDVRIQVAKRPEGGENNLQDGRGEMGELR